MEQYSYYRGTRRRIGKKESVFEEVIAENFPNLGKERVSQAIEVHRYPNTRDPRKTPPKCIIIKMAKTKKPEREIRSHTKENPLSYHQTS